jgi:hypothetical protein
MQHEFLPSTGLMFTASEMLELAEPQTSRPLISFVAASPAKILAMQEEAKDSAARDQDCGTNTPESFANYDQDTCLWRTFQLSLHEGLTPFLGRWPRSGTMRNGTVYRLPTLAPRISGIGSLLWRTPTVEDAQDRDFARNNRGEPKLSAQARHGRDARWPTPTVSTGGPERNKAAGNGSGTGIKLSTAVGGQLSPMWVEWLMGFPLGWTDLED